MILAIFSDYNTKVYKEIKIEDFPQEIEKSLLIIHPSLLLSKVDDLKNKKPQ